jgi:manganese/iron transport system permease protein
MLTWFLEPLHLEFMRNAIAISILIGVLCPVVGSYLIVQRMALLGDVIAHCVLPGLSISFFLGIDILIGSFASGILGTFIIAWIRSQSRVKVDAAMALTFSSFFALGVTLITTLKNKIDLDYRRRHAHHYCQHAGCWRHFGDCPLGRACSDGLFTS